MFRLVYFLVVRTYIGTYCQLVFGSIVPGSLKAAEGAHEL